MLKIAHKGAGKIFYATPGSAGFDITSDRDVVIKSGEFEKIPTGIYIIESNPVTLSAYYISSNQLFSNVPCMCEVQIRPRSGLAAKHGVTVLNSPSTIDCDYTGEWSVILINHGKEDFHVKKGDRIAQAVCCLVTQVQGVPVNITERGGGGFGSTGV